MYDTPTLTSKIPHEVSFDELIEWRYQVLPLDGEPIGQQSTVRLEVSTIEDVNRLFSPENGDAHELHAVAIFYAAMILAELTPQEKERLDQDFLNTDGMIPSGKSAKSKQCAERDEETGKAYDDELSTGMHIYRQLMNECVRVEPEYLHELYLKSLRIQARSRILKYGMGILSYKRSIAEDTTMSQEEKTASQKQLSSVRFMFIDPIKNYADKVVHDDSDDYIDTANLDTKRTTFNLDGFYDGYQKHQVGILLKDFEPEIFRMCLTHELEHSRSQNVRSGNATEMRYRKIGFMTLSDSSRSAQKIIMHRHLNEGFNDYKELQRLGLDPLGQYKYYRSNREVLGRLIALTGQQLWDDAYSPVNTFDKVRRHKSYRALAQSLAAIGGAGFLNRLDTTWALHGTDYVLEILERKAYEELTYTRIPDLKTRYKEIRDADHTREEVELWDLQLDILRQPITDSET